MRIVDVSLDELKRAQRKGRARSEQTRELIEAIESLRPGEAKAVVVEPGETIAKVRARLTHAARSIDKPVQTVADGDRVVFGLKKRGPGRPPKKQV